jgi:4-methyl-5(b-hydroxyethyl)-thiazole monophosphate biosynthesis
MKRVLLFLPQGFEEYEAAVFTDVLGWSRDVGVNPVEVVTAGLRRQVECTWSLTVEPRFHISELDVDDFDALALPGGFEERGFYEDAYDDRFLDLLRRFDAEKKVIASVCVGALPLGKSGILQGRKATTYHLGEGLRRRQLAEFGAEVLDQHLVVDEHIITSTAPASALDVAFKLLEMLTCCENLRRVKTAMGFPV